MNSKKDEKISVIIPIYNLREYVVRCVDSIIKQTYENLEIILVDDGSTDGSDRICDEYLKHDSRICVIHKKNGGLVSARKAGLELASGKYIGFVDADDYIDEEFYEHLVYNIIETGADFVQMGYKQIAGNDVKNFSFVEGIFDVEKNREKYISNVLNLGKAEDMKLTCNIWSKLYKSKLIKKCYSLVPDCQQYGEDVLSTCLCLIYASKFSVINQMEYFYQVREESISHKLGIGSLINIFHLYEYLCKVFESQDRYIVIKQILDAFLIKNAAYWFERVGKIEMPKYYFNDIDLIKDKKIILYGMGQVGMSYFWQLCRDKDTEIVALVDSNLFGNKLGNFYILNENQIKNDTFDIIIISVLDSNVALDIKRNLIKQGIESKKIHWNKPKQIYDLLYRIN